MQETKSKAGPKNPTLPLHQNREGWDTHFKTFGEKRVNYGPKNPTLPIHQNREGWGTHFKTFGEGWATRPFSQTGKDRAPSRPFQKLSNRIAQTSEYISRQ